jgi:hypothetical protein
VNLKSPPTLLAAWALVPLAVVVASVGLGVGVRLISGLRLGVLLVPAGFLAGIAFMSAALEVGLGGRLTVALCGLAALAGPVAWALLARRRGEAPWPRPSRGALWAGACGLAAYGLTLAPLAGSGRSGVLGYVLNNDSVVHLILVESIAENGAQPVASGDSTYGAVTSDLESGYPLGTYAWPVFGRVVSGVEPFHLWAPLVAVAVAMLALVAFALVRAVGASPRFAGIAAAVIGAGYLPFSYAVQGSAKEILMPVTILGTVALAAQAFERTITWRALLPAAFATAAAVANLGYAALAWLGPAALVALVLLAVRARRQRSARELRSVAVFAAAAVPFALPSALASVSFFEEGSLGLESPNELGNLFATLPLRETLGIWLASDYRLTTPEAETLTLVGAVLAAAVAVAGAIHLVRLRSLAPLLALFTAVVGAALVYPQVSIYFESKTLVVVAPAIGVVIAAGVLWLQRLPRQGPALAAAAGALLVAGSLASLAYAYTGVWVTPKDRFEELADINDRFAGQGPLLVNDREHYAAYLLRDVTPWDDWAVRQPAAGLRYLTPPGVPHAPDFDDYALDHVARFNVLLERKRPGGSRPPAAFEPAFETASYRVWRRTGPNPRMHLPLGVASRDGTRGGPVDGVERLVCGSSDLDAFIGDVRRLGGPQTLTVAVPGPLPEPAIDASFWVAQETPPGGAPPPGGLISRRGGSAASVVDLEPGEYAAHLQGSFGPGVRLWVEGAPAGDVLNDLGLPGGWKPIGRFRTDGPTRLQLTTLDRSPLMPGSRHPELTGPLLVQRVGGGPRLVQVGLDELSRFCGRRVDWVELP